MILELFQLTPHQQKVNPLVHILILINIKRKLETNEGNFFSIDVQPDMRFFTYYVSTTTTEQYQTMVIENHPYVSLPSIIGYKIALYIGQLLILVLHARKTKSCFSEIFEEKSHLSALLANLMTCRLPSDVRIPLEQMAPLKDPLRPELEFVPNLACFDMKLDVGRTIPAFAYFMIHDYLSTIPEGSSTKEIMNMIYTLVIYTHNGADFTISNLFGGPYATDAHNTT